MVKITSDTIEFSHQNGIKMIPIIEMEYMESPMKL